MKRLLNIHEVCEYLNCSRWMAYKLIRENELESVRIGKSLRVTVVSIDKFIDGGGQKESPGVRAGA